LRVGVIDHNGKGTVDLTVIGVTGATGATGAATTTPDAMLLVVGRLLLQIVLLVGKPLPRAETIETGDAGEAIVGPLPAVHLEEEIETGVAVQRATGEIAMTETTEMIETI